MARKVTDKERASRKAADRLRRETDPYHWRNINLRRKYGITPEAYDALLEVQNGVCAACKEPEAPTENGTMFLGVDHDHATGRVRGLLCRNCNLALGFARDSRERLMQLVSYLGDCGDYTEGENMNQTDGPTMTPEEEAAWVDAMRAGGQRAYEAANGARGEYRPIPRKPRVQNNQAVVDALMAMKR